MSPEKNQPENVDLESLDISSAKREELRRLFPGAFTETKIEEGGLVESIDFEKLKAELGTFSDLFEARRERYGTDWPGKKECMKLIQKPSLATLKPCREESVDFDETENVFIEGDNLEVLKLLQRSYYGKIKMIYIDPPYNTGKEFIYPDDYSESLETYLAYAGLVDDEGKRFSTNTANEGRFHTKWLNMMTPRLYLARNLLADNGVAFLSIGDSEVHNLVRLCDELFGEENRIAIISRLMKSGGSKGAFFSPNIDYVLVYAKRIESTTLFRDEISPELIKTYYHNIQKTGPRKGERYGIERVYVAGLDIRPNQRYWIKCPDGSHVIPPGSNFPTTVVEGEGVTPASDDGVWKWIYPTYKAELDKGNIEFKKTTTSALVDADGSQSPWNIYNKIWLKEQQEKGRVPINFISKYENRHSSAELKQLDIPFDFAKPSGLISHLARICRTSNNDIVLDFFAGSCSTAHAILSLNQEDNANRKYIMIQLPESCDPESEAGKAGYETIADIGKERIRRVLKSIGDNNKERQKSVDGDLIKSLAPTHRTDLGFKVLKLDRSSFRVWSGTVSNSSEADMAKQLDSHIDHIDRKATQEDILYELLLKAGFMPTEKVEKTDIHGKVVHSIAGGLLLICLEDEITRDLIDAVAEAEPLQFICLDRGFQGNDQLKANAVQTFAARNQGRDKPEQIVFRTI